MKELSVRVRLLMKTHPSCIETSVTCTPLLDDTNANGDIVSEQDGYSAFFRDGGTGQAEESVLLVNSMLAQSKTHIRLCSQFPGKGREGTRITPMPAFPISCANKCASLAPVRVSLIVWPFLFSTSFLSVTSVEMTSALSTFTTRGIWPY